MNCKQCRKQLSQYVDAELREGRQAAVEVHLHDCRGCARVLEELRQLRGELLALPTAQPRTEVRLPLPEPGAGHARVWLRTAAVTAAVGLVLVVVALLRLNWPGPQTTSSTSLPPGVQATPPERLPTARATARPGRTTDGTILAGSVVSRRGPMGCGRLRPRVWPPPEPRYGLPVEATSPVHPHPRSGAERNTEIDLVSVYEAGLALAHTGSTLRALDALRTAADRPEALTLPTLPSPRVLALSGNLQGAAAVYEAELGHLVPAGAGMTETERQRVVESDQMLERDREEILARYLTGKGVGGS